MEGQQHKPVLIVIAGPNGSGKTTITSKILHHEWLEDAEYINPDYVAQNKFGNWNDRDAVLEVAKYCEKWREECLKKRKSLIFETVLSAKDKVDYIRRAKQNGYFIRLFFVCTNSPEINVSRIAQRVLKGGHDVPIEKIKSRFYKSIDNCKEISSFVDRTYVYNNSADNAKPVLLFRMTEGKLAKQYVVLIPLWARGISGIKIEYDPIDNMWSEGKIDQSNFLLFKEAQSF